MKEVKKCISCDRVATTKGRCTKCYNRDVYYHLPHVVEKRKQDLINKYDPNFVPPLKKEKGKCKEEGCDNREVTKGFCQYHYLKNYVNKSAKKCSKCDEPAKAKGLCQMHYTREVSKARKKLVPTEVIKEDNPSIKTVRDVLRFESYQPKIKIALEMVKNGEEPSLACDTAGISLKSFYIWANEEQKLILSMLQVINKYFKD